MIVGFDTSQSRKFGLLPGGSLPGTDFGAVYWVVHFNPSDTDTYQPDVLTSSGPRASGRKKSCNANAMQKPYLCPPSTGETPDISLSGSFLAAGGTKPLYTFELLGGLYNDDPNRGASPPSD